jgi:Mrp family chromosome partitioning ATPase
LLLEADLRRPTVAQQLGIPAGKGVSDVLIGAVSLTAVSDAFPLLKKVDGVVIVGRVGRNRRDIAERLHETLAGAGAPLLGVIANGFKAGRGKGYGYGYGYDYAPAKPVQPSGPPESGPGSVDGVSPDGAGSVEQPAVPTAGP